MQIDSLVQQWDGEATIIHQDKPTGAMIVIAAHSTMLGPSAGGTRIKPYPSLADAVDDAHRLAEGMTLKFAVAGLPYGGGKAVIRLPAGFEQTRRNDLLRRYGALVKKLNGFFLTGPDVGTSPEDMVIIRETAGNLVNGLPESHGGIGDSGKTTAVGLFHGIQAVITHLDGDSSLAGKRVLVQGAGSVGGALIERLLAAGVEVSFYDLDDTAVARYQAKGAIPVPSKSFYQTPCDIFAPCALGAILNAETIPLLQCRAVAGGANNQLATPEDVKRLGARNILYIPDFVLNIGGAIGVLSKEVWGWSPEQIDQELLKIAETTRQVISLAAQENIDTETAARQLAQANLGNPQKSLQRT